MKKPAYDECYLDMMIQKGRYLFKLIGRNCGDVFCIITEYMKGNEFSTARCSLRTFVHLSKSPCKVPFVYLRTQGEN